MSDPHPPAAAPAPHHARAVRLACLPEILDLDAVAEALGVTRDGARRMVVRGEIPGAKIGRRWRVRRTGLLDAIRERETSVVAPGRPAVPRPRADLVALLAGRRRGGRS